MGPAASARLLSPSAARRLLIGGAIALGETYVDGGWDTADLGALLELGQANAPANADTGPRTPRPSHRAAHARRSNSVEGAKRNIAEHYDLGNEFYRLWLDGTMTYSCALFGGHDRPLDQAQAAKYDRILEIADIRRGQRVLELGCGWGGFATLAARETGARVTAVTLSGEQYEHALERVRREDLEGRVEVRLADYRQIDGVFDRVVSIEMFEAVGEAYWPTFFRSMRDRLVDGGRAALQTITIDEARYDDYRSRPDFIQRYVFPGGMLPTVTGVADLARDAGLAMEKPAFYGPDYAHTIDEWLARFDDARDAVCALGFDERFIRLWRYYLAYCRAGFLSGSIDLMQVGLST